MRAPFEGWILFHSAALLMRILFKGGHHMMCGYYKKKYGIPVSAKTRTTIENNLLICNNARMKP
jgi:hypothetical protein